MNESATYYGEHQAEDAMSVMARWISQNNQVRVIYHSGTAVDADIYTGVIRIPRLACASGLTQEALMLLRTRVYHEAGHIDETKILKSVYPKGALFEIWNALEDRRMEAVESGKHMGCEVVFRWSNNYFNKKIAEKMNEGKTDAPLWEALVAMSMQVEGLQPAWTLSPKAKDYADAAYPEFMKVKSCKNATASLDLARVIYKLLKDVNDEWKKSEPPKPEQGQKPQQGQSGEGKPGEGNEEGEPQQGGQKDFDDYEDDKPGKPGEGQEGSGSDEEEESEDGKEKGKGKSKKSKADKGDKEDKEGKGKSGKKDSDEKDGKGKGQGEEDKGDESGKDGAADSGKDGDPDADSDGEGSEGSDQDGEESKEVGSGKGDGEGDSDSDSTEASDEESDGKPNGQVKPGDVPYVPKEEEAKGGKGDGKDKRDLEDEFDGLTREQAVNEDLKDFFKNMSEEDKAYISRRDLDTHMTPETTDEDKTSYRDRMKQVSATVAAMTRALDQALRSLSKCRKNPYLRNGKIDHGRLVAIAKNLSREVFFKTKDGTALDVAVAITLDESGSMGNFYEIQLLAMAIGEALNSIGVPFEILGTTTVYGGGDRRMPMMDGFTRVNPIQYKHYKNFNEQWVSVRERMVHTGAYHHNVDGEVVEYAAFRLKQRKERRKVIFSLSDGEPCAGHCNDKTMCENLKRVCSRVRKEGIEVYGFGIATDSPKEFYGAKWFVKLAKVGEMGSQFTREFVRIVTEGKVKV